jgi:hypothetical protein
MGGVVIPSSEIKKAPTLVISVQESPDDFSEKKDYFLEINAQGLQNGKRGKHDGSTIIGTRGQYS